MLEQGVAGLIVSPARGTRPDAFRRVEAAGVPVVFAMRRLPESRIPVIAPDNHRGAWLAARHLVGKGHRRLAFFGGSPDLVVYHERLGGFREACREEGCYRGPRPFASDHTRVAYFRQAGRHPDVEVFDDTRGEVVVMCGLPGAGKDTYVRERLGDCPVVSLDALRDELDIEPGDAQGAVVQAARERAKEHLRRGERFVWNATNLTRQRRGPIELHRVELHR